MSVINSKKHINRLLFTFLLSLAHYQVKFVLFFLFCFSLRFLTERKNGFAPYLHSANVSKSGQKLQQMWCKWGKCHICFRFTWEWQIPVQMWHSPHLHHICYSFGPDLLTFALRKYGVNPFSRPVFFLIYSDDFHSCLSILLVVGCLRPTI